MVAMRKERLIFYSQREIKHISDTNGGVSFLIKLREDERGIGVCLPYDVESELFEMTGEVSVVLAGFACKTCLSLRLSFLLLVLFFEGLWRPDLILLYPF